MAPNPNDGSDDLTPALLKAILLVLLDNREEPDLMTKPEVLFTRAGLSVRDISTLLGKKEDTIRKAVTRAQ